MKKIIPALLLITVLSFYSCNLEQEYYSFDNFKETPLWELAQAVRADDASEVKQILKNKKLKIDLKEPNFKQTLLALAIQNHKKNAFLELLKSGANANELVGDSNDATPFIYAIRRVENCDLFYVENMLKHGANPNLEIINPHPEYVFFDSYPLLAAIGKNDNNGKECLSLIRLLVDNGANINCCYKEPGSDLCEGVIANSLTSNCMETLKYFVIDKRIIIPDTVVVYEEMDGSTLEALGLKEILNSEKFKFEDFESETGKHDRSHLRKAKNEILNYLERSNK